MRETVSNRRTGFMIWKKELDLVSKRGIHLSVCFLDVVSRMGEMSFSLFFRGVLIRMLKKQSNE